MTNGSGFYQVLFVYFIFDLPPPFLSYLGGHILDDGGNITLHAEAIARWIKFGEEANLIVDVL